MRIATRPLPCDRPRGRLGRSPRRHAARLSTSPGHWSALETRPEQRWKTSRAPRGVSPVRQPTSEPSPKAWEVGYFRRACPGGVSCAATAGASRGTEGYATTWPTSSQRGHAARCWAQRSPCLIATVGARRPGRAGGVTGPVTRWVDDDGEAGPGCSGDDFGRVPECPGGGRASPATPATPSWSAPGPTSDRSSSTTTTI